SPRIGEHELTSIGRQQALAFTQWVMRSRSYSEESKETPFDKAFNPSSIWSKLSIDLILVSPMLRALQTAEILHNALRIPCEIVVDLHEWGGPSELDPLNPVRLFRGRNRDDLQASFPFICQSG